MLSHLFRRKEKESGHNVQCVGNLDACVHIFFYQCLKSNHKKKSTLRKLLPNALMEGLHVVSKAAVFINPSFSFPEGK